jgi:hypothetical protein
VRYYFFGLSGALAVLVEVVTAVVAGAFAVLVDVFTVLVAGAFAVLVDVLTAVDVDLVTTGEGTLVRSRW